MNDFLDEYTNIFKQICLEIDKFNFNCSNICLFKIDSFEDEFHNKLAAYNICEKINKIYECVNIKAKLSIEDTTEIIVYHVKKDLFIKRIIVNIRNKIKFYYEHHKAA